jgi:hypothetical protein
MDFDRDDYVHRMNVCSTSTIQLADEQVVHTQQIGNITVVRDDLLCGGSKYRYMSKLLPRNYTNYVYVSTPFGGLQICLALVVKEFNEQDGGKRRVYIVAERGLSAFQQAGVDLGATLVCDGLPQLPDTYIVPNGFDTYSAHLALSRIASEIRSILGQFDVVVSVAATGSLIRGLQAGHLGKEYYAVGIYHAKPDVGEATYIQYKLPYYERAPLGEQPPFPSAKRYDAKGWQLAVDIAIKHPNKRILFWNVM